MSRRIAKIALVLLGLAVAAGVTMAWKPIVQFVTTKRVTYEELGYTELDGHPIRGWATIRRWSNTRVQHGLAIGFYVENGFKAAVGIKTIGPKKNFLPMTS